MKVISRKYCRACNTFVFESDGKLTAHEEHDLVNGITDGMLEKPIESILKPIVVNSANAV